MDAHNFFNSVQLESNFAASLPAYNVGNGIYPMDYISRHHFPLARGAGKMGTAGGYEQKFRAGYDGRYEGMDTRVYSLTGPTIAAAVMIALLYMR